MIRTAIGSIILAVFFSGMLVLSGCYSYKAFSPSELPKLNKTYTTLVGIVRTNSGAQTLHNNSYSHLKTPDGRILAVEGRPSEVRLKLSTGKVLRISTPYQFEPNGERLTILTASGPPVTVAYRDIDRAEVLVPDLHFPRLGGRGAVITVTVITCLTIGLVVVAMMLASDERSSAYKSYSGMAGDPFPSPQPGWHF